MRFRYALPRQTATVLLGLLSSMVVIFGFIAAAPYVHAESLDSAVLTEDAAAPFPDERTIQSTLDEYLVIESGGSQRFDTERAAADHVDSRIIEIGDQANYIMNDRRFAESDKQLRDLNPTNYGRWCGKNNSGPGEPIDSLDRACMGHDHCLNIRRPVCDCDREFINRLRQIRGEYSGWSRTYLEAAIVVVPRWHGCKV